MILKNDGWLVKTSSVEGMKLEEAIRAFGTVYVDDRNPKGNLEKTRVWTRKFIIFLNPETERYIDALDSVDAFFYQQEYHNAVIKLTYDYRGEKPTCSIIVKEGDIQILQHNFWHCSNGHREKIKIIPPTAVSYLVLCQHCSRQMTLKRPAIFPGLRRRLQTMEAAGEKVDSAEGVASDLGKA